MFGLAGSSSISGGPSELPSKERIASYKPLLDSEVGRQARNEQTLEIRKQKKHQALKKKRGMSNTLNNDDEEWMQLDDEHIVYFFNHATSNTDRLDSIRGLRCILATCEDDATVNTVVHGNALPRLVEYLSPRCPPEFVYESLWCINNIAATAHSQAVFNSGAVKDIMYHLKNSTNNEVRETCIMALTNIVSDGGEMRLSVLSQGLIDILLDILHDLKDPTESLGFHTIWSLCTICQEPLEDGPAMKITATLGVVFCNLVQLQKKHLAEIMNDILWAFSYLSKSRPNVMESVVQLGMIPYLVTLLNENQINLQIQPVLKVLGNIVAGTEAQTQSVLDAGILAFLQPLFHDATHPWEIRKEAAWMASNICAGSQAQVRALFETGLIEDLALIALEDRWQVRNEAIWAIANFCTGHGSKYIQNVIDQGGIAPLVTVLAMTSPSEDMICEVLDALHKILEVGGSRSREIIEEYDGHVLLNELTLESKSEIAAKKASKILGLFFGGETFVDECENCGPQVVDKKFKFGINDPSMEATFDFGDNSNRMF
ncbi:Armadillo-type fold [Nitzschia inconspicua]|uniref:Importin subunit alpha n=1 Tax=Nitzschia inconspicua TaxID=303405 RepID=A0A9K3LMQ1_9STRA|nr:Armadillo-type fold [Nitzschia inconspicua]